ncbi:molybdenum cofactor biosynthesis protein MoaB [Neobacillus sp. MM2021_6]|uniref:MogA/MoaB family molybdenum cofactor biosynthesis protein n=1 Tax=Bacillaceae TaxID=186817 RepID=UPI0014075A04|nr:MULTISPECIES: molybdenum cofactor biosynthesis protein B [Bacillaceae]MBO0960084.1 molybdenum cofactor biosynthesis protein MoaB [Neobacillus sp. MM2021_6]NHC17494.1 molybdenum cofactor biosynthesis protein MoaB [Bacillus sp. MM2020_4]
MSTQEHKKEAPKSVHCKVITVSDTRDKETDKSGKLMITLLEGAGHTIVDYVIVKDEAAQIQNEIVKGCDRGDIDVILTNGGTGIAKRDVTIETVQNLLEKEIVGFGELFRMLSYQEDIGSSAILSRAIAGVVKNKAVFSTPGSTGAVKLAMNKLILPELGHVVREIRKDI